MIYTVTFNPSIDYMVSVDSLQLGDVNRTIKEYILPGGKGINVSIVLGNLKVENIALGFVGGFTGQEIKHRVEKEFNVKTDFIDLEDDCSRINVKIRDVIETEINGNGPRITEQNIYDLESKLQALSKEDVLVLSGSVPKGVSNNIYNRLMYGVQGKSIKIVVDATGDLLMKSLEHKPFLVKPNNHELAQMFHVKLSSVKDIVKYAKKLQVLGAQNVLVSMAGDGAVFVCENGKAYFCEAPKGKVKNSVGAGDSMVAGFIAGYVKKNSYIEAFKTGVAAGSASAFSDNLATQEEVKDIIKIIKEIKL